MFKPSQACGVLLINKPAGISSHVVVSQIKKHLRSHNCSVKVGHLGTLDPFATGLLPILLGGATRLSDLLHNDSKQYRFTIQLGQETSTLDPQGNVTDTAPVPDCWIDKVPSVVTQFLGKQQQVPPAYSALKFQGRPLYEYMRTVGKLPLELAEKTREVVIESLEVVSTDSSRNQLTLTVDCTKGTYVRCLARDMAKTLGTRGYCVQLRRQRIGTWHDTDAIDFEEMKTFENFQERLSQELMTPYQLLPEVPAVALSTEQIAEEKLLANGNPISLQHPTIFTETKTSHWIFVSGSQEDFLFLCDYEKREKNFILVKPRIKLF